MSEHSEKLKATIAELELELQSVDELDADTRAMLRAAVEEIEAALQVEETSADASEPHTLAERLNDAAIEFDTSHPTVAGLLRRIVDALAQIGI